jgi:hypothetical protein
MPYDYTDAPAPRAPDLIPLGTIASVTMHIRPGNAGEDGQLTRSKDGLSAYLDCEFVVVDGEHAKRKFWDKFLLEGTTDGHAQMIDTNRLTLKAVLDSAFGLDPNDKTSPEVRAARTVSLKQFEGVTFMAEIGIEKGKPKNDGSGKNWADKNILAGVITKEKKDWHPVEQPPPFNGGSGGASSSTPPQFAPPIARPGWAS